MKILSIALGLTLALGLTAGMVLPGLAAPDAAAPTTDDFQTTDEPLDWGRLLPNMLRGEVTSIDEGKTFFVIESQEQKTTILVNDDTQYFIASLPQKLAALAKNRLELRQRLEKPQPWQIKPQEKVSLEEPASIKLMPINKIIEEKPIADGQVTIKLWPLDRVPSEMEAVPQNLKPINIVPEVVKEVPQNLKTVDRVPERNQMRISPVPAPQPTQSQAISSDLPTPSVVKETPQSWAEMLKWLRRFGEKATFDDLTVGAQALVRTVSEEASPLAKWVLIIKPTNYQTVVGTVTNISLTEKTITIAPADGNEAITVNYNEGTRFILRGTPKLEVGQSARAVCNEEMTAKVISAPIEAIELAD